MRNISLLLRNGTSDDITKIKEFCNNNNIEFKYRYSRERINSFSYNESKDENEIKPLYYFYIIGNTEHYNKLKELMGDKILTTNFADICNIADSDNSFESNLKNVLDIMKKQQNIESKANKEFINFIMLIKDVNVLIALNEYSGYMSQFQKNILKDRIDICNNERHKIDEEMKIEMLSLGCDVKKLREKTGMNRRQFCDYFGIPYRTVEDWENKKSTCSKYLFDMMETILNFKNKI